MTPSQQTDELLSAVLALIPWAEQIHKERHIHEQLTMSNCGSENAESALTRAYAVLIRWATQEQSNSRAQDWMRTVKFGDLENAAVQTAKLYGLRPAEAQVLVRWYRRVLEAQQTLLSTATP